MSSARCLVWLEWPEACFRANGRDMKYLASLLPPGADVRRVRSERAFLAALPQATHVITWHFAKSWYARARRLKVLATPGAGRELIAWREAPEGVKVHFGGFHGQIMAESVAAFCLAWARGFFKVVRQPPRTGIWPRDWLGGDCFTLAGTRAVIAGYGRIGRAIGAKLAALGVTVEGFGRGNLAELPHAAKSADWFILALPGDTGTDNFLDAKLMRRLPQRCVVVNVGRGNAVDEAALKHCLATGRLAGAYLDVFKDEPTVLNDLKRRTARDALYEEKLPTLVAMPHCSAFAPQYLRLCFQELKDDGLL